MTYHIAIALHKFFVYAAVLLCHPSLFISVTIYTDYLLPCLTVDLIYLIY